jgi:hypothetical protein
MKNVPLQVGLHPEDREYFVKLCFKNKTSASEVLRKFVLKVNKKARKERK